MPVINMNVISKLLDNSDWVYIYNMNEKYDKTLMWMGRGKKSFAQLYILLSLGELFNMVFC